MGKGFLSFVIASVFLLSLLSSAIIISSAKPDISYERHRRLLLENVAIKQSFYRALSDAASSSLSSSPENPYAAVRASLFGRLLEFQPQLQSLGYGAIFWCGEVSDAARSAAALEMASAKRAILPEGALPAEACADSFDANLLTRKIRLQNAGFSFYDEKLGMGAAASFPPSYEVDF